MQRELFMSEKYAIPNCENIEDFLKLEDDWLCTRVCRYGDGYVYRIQREFSLLGQFPWESKIAFLSAKRKIMYISEIFDQVRIHMTDFEHGTPYAVGFACLKDDAWIHFDCQYEVWRDQDIQKLDVSPVERKAH